MADDAMMDPIKDETIPETGGETIPETGVEDRPAADMRELGSTGLRKFSGVVMEELFPELDGERGRLKYKEMGDNDPVLSGLLYTFEMLFRQAEMTIRPGHEKNTGTGEESAFEGEETFESDVHSEQAKEIAEFVESCFHDMSHSFSDFMSQVASMFQYGWDGHEIVYKERKGFNARNPGKNSRFDDGKIGWRKFAHRDQKSLEEWDFDEKGDIRAFVQYDVYRERKNIPAAREVRIPIQKMLLFRTSSRANNPEGKSMLRGAYRPWYFKKRIEEIEAIGIERDLAGMPIIYAPAELFNSDASEEQKYMLNSLKGAVQNIRRDAQDGMVFPLSYDEGGHELYRFELASTGGRRQIDTNEIVRRRNMEMAMSVLADFMMLGHESTGSFALSQDKTNLFSMAIDGFLIQVADVLNRHAIPRLLLLNGMPLELAPTVTFDNVRAPTLAEIGEYIQRLARAGAPFFPDDKLQAWLHQRAGLPEPVPQSVRNQEEEEARLREQQDEALSGAGMVDDAGGEGWPGGEEEQDNDGSLMIEGDGTTGDRPSPPAGTPRGDTDPETDGAFD